MFRGRIWLLLALSLGLGACTGAPTAHTPSGSRPSASAAVAVSADPQRCARLAKKGFTPCPPTPDRLQLPPTTIKNATNGAITDATAQEWGRAFQLTEAYYRWALQANARTALTSGVLAEQTASTIIFGQDLQSLDDAKQRGGRLIDEEGSMPEVKLVSLPSDLQSRITRQGLTPKTYAVAARFAGTTSRSIQFPDGHVTPIGSVSIETQLLIWGEFRSDPDMGQIWYESGLYGCQYPEVAVVCQQ